ncbi:MAG: peptidoglycan DD-metalloendopeptidase family protein [Microcoleus sp. PH2017_22_RUC_O_B]|uniref:S8 family serine peptidase n=1 Tax=unclassified Microcoleus TaxID=2642155 RepID=UPI001D58CC00|nr:MULTISPECIES: S8 family serine peptidase [unclassified Microcoleus]MCC3527538.1 peptidoglycan DD-metalloendopeptidase family protein [Microcoleus sp. PH2017_21_RUC_O_A]MCC3539577.1 peptidoglycan DD-metalloendopeptidase family protein [Microcoleus sp. PH2017_22_RUC_O_B]
MGWLNFGGKKRKQAQGFGNSPKRKSRKKSRSHVLERIVTPSAGVAGWLDDLNPLHQLFGSLSLPDLHLPNFLADSGVCPIDPAAPTSNLPPLIDFDPLGLYHDGIATQSPYNPGGAFETLPVAIIPIDPHSPNPNDPNAIRQFLNFPLASQPYVGTIDTGVSADSPYLNYANIKKGRDYVGGDDNPLLKAGEGSEHGTFMLGIIDAINKTAPKWVGRAIDSGRWADSLVEFVDAAKASGQKNAIANLSLDLTQKNADGSVTTRYELTPQERSAIEYARQNGVMLVVAAGNDGGVMSVLGQASQEFDNIFTVGAGDINGRSIYSSFGRGLDILADGGTTEHPGLSTVGNDLGTMAGTSVATAKVAGAASLVWAANPALNYRQVMEILKSTARDLGPVGWDDETGFGFLNTLAAVDLAKKTRPEVYKPTAWVTPDTWSGQGKVTPEERAAKGGNSLAAATVQASSSFSDSDRVDSNQPEKYYQFTVTEPGYVSWNLTSLNPVSGFPTPPQVTVTKADGKPGSHTFFKGASLQSSIVGEGQTSFQGGNFYDPGTYYLKVGNGAWSTFNDYNISTQFIADRVSTFTGNIQYRTQPYYSLDNSLQSAVFSGSAVSDLSNLSGVVTYDNIQFNNRIAKYGVEVNESGKIRINLNSANGKMEVSVNKFIGSDDRPKSIASLEVSANSDGWLELDLNKGRYDIEVKTPSNFWLEPDWNSTQQKLVRPYTLNATFTPNAPQPGQGKVPSSAGAFDKTVVSNGVVNHYYKNGYLTVQPSGQASWYSYGTGNAIGVIEISAVPLPFEMPPDYAGNLPNTARDIGTLIGTQTFHDVIDRNDRFDYYKFNITSESKVDFALSGKMGNTGFYLFQDWYFNSDDSTHIDIISGTPPGVVPEFSETLKPGTYYVLVHKPKDYDGDEYDLKLSAVPLDYAGNTLDNARIIPVDSTTKVFKDFVGQTDGDDYYRFDLQEERQVIMTLDGFSAGATVDVLKKVPSNGQLSQLARFDNGTDVKFLDGVLDAGTYYVRVAPNSTGANTNYNFNFSALRLASGWIDSHIIPINPEPSIPQWQKDIDNTYQSARNLLGNPTGSYGRTVSSLNGAQGYGRNYDYGTVYWSAQSGAIALWHGFANTYNENGGFSGWLGFPTKANENWKDGQRIDFEGGYIYWTAQSGAKAYRPNESPSLDKTVGYDGTNTHQTYVDTFNRNGGSSALGSATGNVHPSGTENGYVQEFSGGSEGSGAIMKSGANDYSYWVGGDFWAKYLETGGVTGVLGYPTSDRYEFNGGWKQDFQGGALSTTLPLTPTPNSGENTSPTYPSPTPQANNPSGFTPVLFTRSSGVDTNYGIKLRTDTRLNAPSEGVTYAAQFEFDGWKHGEAVQDKTLPNGKMDAMWYRIKGTNHWIPSAFINGYPPGVTNSVGSNGGDNASGNVGTEFTTPLNSNVTEANPLRGFIHPLGNSKIQPSQGNNTGSHVDRAAYSIDFPANIGTPVSAMRQGKVVAVRDIYPDTGGGSDKANAFNYVLIEHDNGYRSAYIHLQQGFNSSVGLKVGDTVKAGQTIGYSGNSGWSTGPHLHVEVHRAAAGGYLGQTVPFVIDTVGAIGYVDNTVKPIDSPSQVDLTDWIKKFLSSVESSWVASLPDDDENPWSDAFISETINEVEAAVRKTLDLTEKRFEIAQVGNDLGQKLSKKIPIFETVTKAINKALDELYNAVRPALKTIREGASDIATKLLYYAAELKNLGSADPFAGLKEALPVSIQFDDFLRNPSKNIDSLKSFVKKAPNFFKKLPYADGVSFILFDLPDITKALENPEKEDVFEEIAGIAGSTLGGAFAGGLLGAGTVNPIVGVLAAMIGGVLGEILGKFIYNILKSILSSFAQSVSDLLNSGAKALDNYAKYAKEIIKGNNWGLEEYGAALYLALFGTIDVNAAEISQYEAGRAWRDTFGNEYDYLLSPESLAYLP